MKPAYLAGEIQLETKRIFIRNKFLKITVLSALSVTLKRLTKRKKLLTATKKELTKTLTKKLDYFSVHLVVQKSSLMRQLLQLGAIIVIIRLFY